MKKIVFLGVTGLVVVAVIAGILTKRPADTITFVYDLDGQRTEQTFVARDWLVGMPPRWMELVYIQNTTPSHRGKRPHKIVAVYHCGHNGICNNWM